MGKVVCKSTKAAISLIRVKIEEKFLPIGTQCVDELNSSTLFRTVPSPTPYDLLFLKIVL